jgi:hypothetical protein
MKDKKSQTQNVDDDKRCIVETEDVPLYRSYGVTKKVNPTARKIRDFFAKALTVILLAFELALILLTTAMLAFYTDVLIATVLFLILFSIFFFNATKLLRRRLSFLSKLKKTCKKNGYRLQFKREFFKSLSWAEDSTVDFTVKAGKWTYYVKFATSRRFLSSFTFVSKNQMKYTKIARKNRFSIIFDLKDRTRTMPIEFPKGIDDKDKYTVRAVLINPAVMNIERKGSDGVVIPTGSGERLFGYTIYTGTGFIETLKRNAEDLK